MSFRVGMDAVILVEGRIGGDAVEEERIEGDPMAGGNGAVDAVECSAVFGAQIRRRLHADNQDRHPRRFQSADDGIQIRRRGDRVEPPQSVVGAQFDDRRVGLVGEGPVKACQAAGGGIAGNPGVDDPNRLAGGAQRCLETGREGVWARQAVTRRQAVAEGEKPNFPGRRDRRRDDCQRRGNEDCVDNPDQTAISEEAISAAAATATPGRRP